MAGNDIRTDNDGNTEIQGGDFVLETDPLIPLVNRILRTSKGAWRYDRQVGIGLQDYAGQPNTEDTGKMIEDAVIAGLALLGINAKCMVWPLSKDAVAINIQVPSVAGTQSLGFKYVYLEGKVEYDATLTGDSVFQTKATSNKYDQRST